ncbi:MAG: helix-turn-helix domain-containing protein [Reyranella sp.]|uniref:Crp/Fnr family transcriptional regulator n=1 Tax=Reyranella sp. TaxID=1929291 RepID=UPI0027311826|nr:helix-turn-helix domain-containing protein [Reyranella sp.]MDP1965283.1 helix-turn-helix domain-containing protein [Reyranella sp.]MDP2376045.1 helix-turn-helix domain-containing protein [Reyranella sp.]
MTSTASLHEFCARRGDLATPCRHCGAREFNICQALDAAQQDRLFALATRLQLGKRERLFAAGDRARYVYNLTEGTVSVSRSLTDGRRQILGFLLPGDFLGLEAGESHRCDAEALTEAKVCRFERAAFDTFLQGNPEVALRLLQIASSDLAQAARHEVLLGRKTAVERIASFLVDLRDRSGARHLRTRPLVLPMTRSEIADYTGMTIETVSRVLGRLKSRKVIELVGASTVRVLDDAELERLSGSS